MAGSAQYMQRSAYELVVDRRVAANNNEVTCDWDALCKQLMQQWGKLSDYELEATEHNRHSIASLIQRKYGVPIDMAENYLCNFERTLPLLGCA